MTQISCFIVLSRSRLTNCPQSCFDLDLCPRVEIVCVKPTTSVDLCSRNNVREKHMCHKLAVENLRNFIVSSALSSNCFKLRKLYKKAFSAKDERHEWRNVEEQISNFKLFFRVFFCDATEKVT